MKVVDGKKEFLTTDANGKATFTAEKGVKYMANLADVEGMKNPLSFNKDNNLVINVEKGSDDTKNITYTIYVVDASGAPVEGVMVQMCVVGGACKPVGTTDADGKVVVNEDDSHWQAQITGESDYYDFDSNNSVTMVKK